MNDQELDPQLRETIANLRLALTSLAETPAPRPLPAPPARAWQWVLATAACALLTVAALHHPHPAPAPQPTQQEDEALLESIHQDLSTPIAPSLAPLTPTTHYKTTN